MSEAPELCDSDSSDNSMGKKTTILLIIRLVFMLKCLDVFKNNLLMFILDITSPNLTIALTGNSAAVQFGHENILLGEKQSNMENAEISRIVPLQRKISECHVSVINMIDLHEDEHEDHLIGQLVNKNEIHAFIFVVRLGQLTDANKMGLDWIQRVFGDKVLQFVMILFTYEREEECDTIKDIKDPVLEQLVKKCGGRYQTCYKMMNNQLEMRELMNKIELLLAVRQREDLKNSGHENVHGRMPPGITYLAIPTCCCHRLPPAPNSMQVYSFYISFTERHRRIQNHLCLYCVAEGHLLQECPVRPPQNMALIDSGFMVNFISGKLLRHLHLSKILCKETLNIHSIMGKPLRKGIIKPCSPNLTFCIGCTPHEEISLLVLEESTAEIIVGRPWLQVHSPHIHGLRGKPCGKRCFDECLRLPQKPTCQNVQPSILIQKSYSRLQSENSNQISGIPGCVQQAAGLEVTQE
ncbi:GTPase IMAP family member 1 [Anabarilius grahami]|uniref:GTPase IMAP family member 1 n=1 Tax=Anabarilius grahami TaxID=495550 RepID=A0A3N0YGR1_ANAGA|nr:GTPase IMAP family member 1 [Anabarilius grahami]